MRLFFILFLTTLFLNLQAQKDSIKLSNPTILGYYDLEKQQRLDWDSVKKDWKENCYWGTAKKFRKKVDCRHGCEGIWMEVTLQISSEGKLLGYSRNKIRTCDNQGETKIEDYLIQYFREITFPESLHQLNLKVRLGSALKC